MGAVRFPWVERTPDWTFVLGGFVSFGARITRRARSGRDGICRLRGHWLRWGMWLAAPGIASPYGVRPPCPVRPEVRDRGLLTGGLSRRWPGRRWLPVASPQLNCFLCLSLCADSKGNISSRLSEMAGASKERVLLTGMYRLPSCRNGPFFADTSCINQAGVASSPPTSSIRFSLMGTPADAHCRRAQPLRHAATPPQLRA